MRMQQDEVRLSHWGGIPRPVNVQSAASQQPATRSQQLGSYILPGAPPPCCRPEDCPHPLHSLCHHTQNRPPLPTTGLAHPDGGIGPPHSARGLPSSVFCGFSLNVKALLQARSINLPNFGRWKLALTLATVVVVSLVVGGCP